MWNNLVQSLKTTIAITSFLLPTLAIPCSTFMMEADIHRPIFAKNYDWKFGEGHIVVNPSGLSKNSLVTDSSAKTNWVSKYSSVTFNQYGAEFPNGGINEKGLLVEILWLEQTQYEAKDSRPILNELQWIQYQLDQRATTKDVLKNLKAIRIQNNYAKVHYLVCDKSKDCATIEYLKGNAQVHHGKNLPHSVLTNSTYENSKNYIQKFEGFGGTHPIPMTGYGSMDRFARISHLIKNYEPIADPIEYSFLVLDSVKNFDTTQWQIVYDPEDNSIYFRTDFVTTVTGFIETKTLFSTCKKERYFFDLKTPLRGQIKSFFKPLTFEDNRILVKESLTKLKGSTAQEFIEAVTKAPFKMNCSL